MNKIIYSMIVCLLLVSTSCKKDDDNLSPLEQLPPATQTGANTFGCLLDGEAFFPGPGANTLDCVYQFVNGGYYFSLQSNKRDANNTLISLGCSTQDLEINEGQTYQLNEKIDGNAYGKYFCMFNFKYTSIAEIGELTITNLDFTNNIVSGKFWYNIIDCNDVLHRIREGRFDIRFTQ